MGWQQGCPAAYLGWPWPLQHPPLRSASTYSVFCTIYIIIMLILGNYSTVWHIITTNILISM